MSDAERQDGGDGSGEAARWVKDALANARESFPEMSDEELRGPLEQAFDLASRSGRGEREFHALFEAELRRAIEEREVVGSASSVLPSRSSATPQPFRTVAPDLPASGAPTSDDPEPSPHDDEEDRARAFGLAIGALRFHEGLSPEEIQHERGIGPDFYAEVMHSLLGEADRTLQGAYPAHVDRDRMARFAAGLEEEPIGIDRHVGECPGCATYLADLLEAAVRAVEHAAVRQRRDRREPVMSVKAAELRKYSQPARRELRQRVHRSRSSAWPAAEPRRHRAAVVRRRYPTASGSAGSVRPCSSRVWWSPSSSSRSTQAATRPTGSSTPPPPAGVT